MELGGDFELDITQLKDTDDHVFRYLSEYQTMYTDSGRSALRLLQRHLRPPSYRLFSCPLCTYPTQREELR